MLTSKRFVSEFGKTSAQSGGADSMFRGAAVGQPTLLVVTMIAFWVSELLPGQIAGFNISGWLWVGILLVATSVIVRNPTGIRFPILLWTPWIVYLIARVKDWSLLGVQSTLQIILPVIVAAAASTTRSSIGFLEKVDKWMNIFLLLMLFWYIFVGIPWILQDIENSGGIGAGVMALIFQAYFLCRYLLLGYRRWDLIGAVCAVCVPVGLTLRGPILGAVALFILVLAPLSLWKRVGMGILVVFLCVGLFYTPRVQLKMFISGQGSLTDIRKDNKNLNSSGRSWMAETLELGLGDSVWLGHGANSAGDALVAAGFTLREAHNDWLRIRYCYGRVGVIIFALTMIAQVYLLLLTGRNKTPRVQVLLLAGASCFIPFSVVMLTDNILVYCQYFTVPHFLLIGYGYSVGNPVEDFDGVNNSARLVLNNGRRGNQRLPYTRRNRAPQSVVDS